MDKVRILSFGGGQDTTGILCAVAEGLVKPFDAVVFANVGEDSEHPDTLAYVAEVIRPYLAARGVPFVEVRRQHKGNPDSVRGAVFRRQRSVPIPAYMAQGAPGNRTCTHDFKIVPVRRWIKQHYAGRHVELAIGFAADEVRRVKDWGESDWHESDRGHRLGFWRRKVYPLIDIHWTRVNVVAAIARAGLPIPPPSRCYFCPFQRVHDWERLRRESPELFESAAEVEDWANQTRADIGRDGVYLHRSLRPLREAVAHQPSLFELMDAELSGAAIGDCDSGYCGV